MTLNHFCFANVIVLLPIQVNSCRTDYQVTLMEIVIKVIWRPLPVVTSLCCDNSLMFIRNGTINYLSKDTFFSIIVCLPSSPWVVPCSRLPFEQLPLFHSQNRWITVNHSRGLCDKVSVRIAHVLEQSRFVRYCLPSAFVSPHSPAPLWIFIRWNSVRRHHLPTSSHSSFDFELKFTQLTEFCLWLLH